MDVKNASEEQGAFQELGLWLRGHVTARDALVFSGTFLMTMLIHFNAFSNYYINHDTLDSLYGDIGYGLASGRWLLSTMCKLTGAFSNSWFNGTASALWLALAVVFVVRVFQIRQLIPALAVGLGMVAFPVVACTFAYMFTAYPYFFAVACAAMAAYLLRCRGAVRFAVAALLLACSMGCYQAYFGLTAGLLVAALIVDVCEWRWDGDWKPCVLEGLRYVAGLALGMALYMIILRVCLAVTGVQLTDYKGIDQMGHVTPGALLECVAEAYRAFFRFGQKTWLSAVHVHFPGVFLAALAFPFAAVVIVAVIRKLWRRPATLAQLAALTAVLPLAVNIIYVMVGRVGSELIHELMVYPMVIPLILPAVLADRIRLAKKPGWPRRLGALAAAAVLSVTLICGYEGALITGKTYMGLELTYESVYSYLTRLAARIEMQEDFVPGAPVAFSGTVHLDSPIPDDRMMGVFIGQGAMNIYTRSVFLQYFIGLEYSIVSNDVRSVLVQTDTFQAMPCYPQEGSIRTIDGIIVVKFSG